MCYQPTSNRLMETVITNKAMDSSQTEISGEGCWDLWRYGVFLSLLLACAISVSKCSSFINYSICFTRLFLFLFSHTPFRLSPLGGAVFIFGVFILLGEVNDLKITDFCTEDKCCCTVHIFCPSCLYFTSLVLQPMIYSLINQSFVFFINLFII